jgi:hypothetical protein
VNMCEDISVCMGCWKVKCCLGGETFFRGILRNRADRFVSMEGTVREDRHEHRSGDA